jgi:hypothetical protein
VETVNRLRDHGVAFIVEVGEPTVMERKEEALCYHLHRVNSVQVQKSNAVSLLIAVFDIRKHARQTITLPCFG